ncbi:MAG: hypothetical protein M3P91_10735, partial [Actinomycetota bacterium]|nr:hypothetical protein [Actinomycetota bacterium]
MVLDSRPKERDADVQHHGEPHLPQHKQAPPQASGATAEQDVWLALELIVERVARLVLHAYSLAERMDQLDSTPGRDERQARLGNCIELGR